MRVLAAFDKCKDSLSAWEICSLVQKTIRPLSTIEDVKIAPLTDGGEGFVYLLTQAKGGTFHILDAKDSLGKSKKVKIGMISSQKLSSSVLDFMNLPNSKNLAIVEMSSVVGLSDLEQNKRNPWDTCTYGVGELLLGANELGADSILLGIGGSSTNDLGMGAMSALNVEFFSKAGKTVSFPAPKTWSGIQGISTEKKSKLPLIRIACDVNNPLLGENGATFQFGLQKGLEFSEAEDMERNLCAMSKKLSSAFGKSLDSREKPGAGAAGGIGYGLNLAYGAEFLPGFTLVEKWLGLENLIKDSDLIITGEGRFDKTSLCGKGPFEIIRIASKFGKKTILLAGSVDHAAAMQCKSEFSNLEIFAFGKNELSLQENLSRAHEFVEYKVKEIFSTK